MQKRNWLKIFCGIVMTSVALTIGLNNVLQLINLAKYSKAYQEASEVIYAQSFGQQILFTGICIPIVEELLFRGLAFRILRKWIPFVWAMIITALLFGIYHGNLVQFVYATLCGLYLAYLCEKFKTVLASITAHIVMNVLACTVTKLNLFSWTFENLWRVLGVTLVSGMIFTVGFVWFQKMDVTKMLKKDCKS